ncbi:hypothetical protein EOPP23_05445 [Endozoicomonas sp. OPT23]|uniref:hypothetical protein n=1 Tax=Endozoicomonas sp. OPT23 TaxID=2072845 RepID=UPI00129A6017|nr:hypothetical protein [Endozoicomonas sp. OPT23]MRI32428.1 hypothetical protein [Endozoicomonas sp. OPT23]
MDSSGSAGRKSSSTQPLTSDQTTSDSSLESSKNNQKVRKTKYENEWCRLKPRGDEYHKESYSRNHKNISKRDIKSAATLTTYLDPGHAFLRVEDHIEGTDRVIGFYPTAGSSSLGASLTLYSQGRLANELCTYDTNVHMLDWSYPKQVNELDEFQLTSLNKYLDRTQDACDFDETMGCNYIIHGSNCVSFVQQAHTSALLSGHFSTDVSGGAIQGVGKANVYGTFGNAANVPSLFMLGAVLNEMILPAVKSAWSNVNAWLEDDFVTSEQTAEYIKQYLVLDVMQLKLENTMNDLVAGKTRNEACELITLQKQLVDLQAQLLVIKDSFMDPDRSYNGIPATGVFRRRERDLKKVGEDLQLLSDDLVGYLHSSRHPLEKLIYKQLNDDYKISRKDAACSVDKLMSRMGGLEEGDPIPRV